MEGFAIPGLKGTIHTEIEQSALILHHTVHIVAGKGLIRLVLLLEYTELITVVAVDAVTGSNPQESVVIEVNLSNVAAGQLLIVSCEIFAHLGIYAQGETLH